jgi:hypothetical protein
MRKWRHDGAENSHRIPYRPVVCAGESEAATNCRRCNGRDQRHERDRPSVERDPMGRRVRRYKNRFLDTQGRFCTRARVLNSYG